MPSRYDRAELVRARGRHAGNTGSGQAPPPRLARFAAGARGAGGHRVPLRHLVGARRLPRRRPVLRPLGLPDHDAAHPRVAAVGSDRARRVLGPPGPPPPPRAAASCSCSSRSSPCTRSTRGSAPASATTASPASSTSRTGGSSRPSRATSSCSPRRRRCATCGRSRSRSSSTSCGRSWRSRCCAPARGSLRLLGAVCVVGIAASIAVDGIPVRRRRPVARVLRHRRPRAHDPHRARCSRSCSRRGSRAPRRGAAFAIAGDRRVRGDAGRVERRDRHERALLPRRLGCVRGARVRRDRGRAATRRLAAGVVVPPAGVDRPHLLRPLPVPLADRGLAGPDARAPARRRARTCSGSRSRSRRRRSASTWSSSRSGSDAGPTLPVAATAHRRSRSPRPRRNVARWLAIPALAATFAIVLATTTGASPAPNYLAGARRPPRDLLHAHHFSRPSTPTRRPPGSSADVPSTSTTAPPVFIPTHPKTYPWSFGDPLFCDTPRPSETQRGRRRGARGSAPLDIAAAGRRAAHPPRRRLDRVQPLSGPERGRRRVRRASWPQAAVFGCGVASGRDHDDPQRADHPALRALPGHGRTRRSTPRSVELRPHVVVWMSIWEKSDLVVDGRDAGVGDTGRRRGDACARMDCGARAAHGRTARRSCCSPRRRAAPNDAQGIGNTSNAVDDDGYARLNAHPAPLRGAPPRRRHARRPRASMCARADRRVPEDVDGAATAPRRAALHADGRVDRGRSGSCRRSSATACEWLTTRRTRRRRTRRRRVAPASARLARAGLPARAHDRGRWVAAPLDGRGRVHQPAHHRSDLRRARSRSSTPANAWKPSTSTLWIVRARRRARALRRVHEHGVDHAAREPRGRGRPRSWSRARRRGCCTAATTASSFPSA